MISQDVYLYHAQPAQNLDPLRQFVIPDLFVDISTEMETKLKMLTCYESQWKWLKDTQGMENFLENARSCGRELAQFAPSKVQYVEGFRQHSHMGFSATDEDLLSRVLGEKVMKKGELSITKEYDGS
jgi:LmbE family N-acetylglucosaminyl deacetylase